MLGLGLIFFLLAPAWLAAAEEDPLATVRRVADRVIADASFEFTLEPRHNYAPLQRVDFRHELGPSGPAVAYARSEILARDAEVVQLGISSTGPVRIWLNGELVYHRETASATAANATREIEGDLYQLKDAFSVSIRPGRNQILVREEVGDGGEWEFYLAPVPARGTRTVELEFSAKALVTGVAEADWLVLGPLTVDEASGVSAWSGQTGPEQGFQLVYERAGRFWTWQTPRVPLVKTAIVPATSAFRAHSYVSWHYANSNMLFGLLALSARSGEAKYADFVRRCCDFTLDHQKEFEWQFRELHAYRGFDAELFRPVKLDYTTGPALPYAELVAEGNYPRGSPLVKQMADYLQHRQQRLPDGTLCRLEPVASSVWADDLFMSVPFLLRAAKISGDRAGLDEAARQVLQFGHYLFDEHSELFYHGWFSPEKKHSVARWSRANGWMAWAMAETLDALPQNHPAYGAILALFRRHMAGLARVQAPDGLWRQVLDRPDAWEETSGTSMFVLAMARGVQRGWLEPAYAERARRGWRALAEKVDSDGRVHDICQSTPMGFSVDFYLQEERRLNDPRGLGGFITAGVEISRLNEFESRATLVPRP
jgi:rhamnogalacturonyl hydrolase YesR